MRKRSTSESGASAVEFALVLPLLLSVLFFAIDFSWMFYADLQVANAARDGARFGAVAPQGSVESEAEARAEAIVSAMPGMTGAVSATAACVFPSVEDANVTVTVTYDFEPLVGFVFLLNVNLFKQLQAQATMHVENGTGC